VVGVDRFLTLGSQGEWRWFKVRGVVRGWAQAVVGKRGRVWVVTGGEDEMKTYTFDNSTIEEKEGMTYPRPYSALIYHKSMIFWWGGSSAFAPSNQVEVYHTSKDYWEDLESLTHPRSPAHGWAIQGYLYVFSTAEEEKVEESRTYEVFEAKMIYGKWKVVSFKAGISSVPKNVCCFGREEENKIFVLQPSERKLYEFDLGEKYLAYRLKVEDPILEEFCKCLDAK
jgi:hypothetical protein